MIRNFINDLNELLPQKVIEYIEAEKNKLFLKPKSVNIHNGIVESIRVLSQKYGYYWEKEYEVLDYIENKRGKIDLVLFNSNYKIAIEVDSSPRKKSIQKIMMDKFNYKIWICCGNRERFKQELINLNAQDDVFLIEVPSYRNELSYLSRNNEKHI